MKAILFDFDGTLIDSAPDHLRAYRASLAHYGIDLTPERYFATYSPNWHQMYAALGLPQTAWEEADAAWLAEVANHESPLFPGVVPLLSNLGQRSTLGLVTAGSRSRVMQQLKRTGFFQESNSPQQLRSSLFHPVSCGQ